MKILALNITPAGGGEYDFVAQVLEDAEGQLLKGNPAVLLIADGANDAALADVLGVVGVMLREDGAQSIYQEAVTPDSRGGETL
jgi:hypothetical protein